MVFRSAWAVMMLAGLAFTAGSCGAYPDREFKSGDASVSSERHRRRRVDPEGTAVQAAQADRQRAPGGGDASVAVLDAAKDNHLRPTSKPMSIVRFARRLALILVSIVVAPTAPWTTSSTRTSSAARILPTSAPPGPCADKLAARGARSQPRSSGCRLPGHGNVKPRFNYWIEDDLQLTSGTASGSCAVNKLMNPMNEPCAGQPMHICVPSANGGRVTDPVGGTCDLHDCGFETIMPNNYFGGCTTNRTAGTLCYCP